MKLQENIAAIGRRFADSGCEASLVSRCVELGIAFTEAEQRFDPDYLEVNWCHALDRFVEAVAGRTDVHGKALLTLAEQSRVAVLAPAGPESLLIRLTVDDANAIALILHAHARMIGDAGLASRFAEGTKKPPTPSLVKGA